MKLHLSPAHVSFPDIGQFRNVIRAVSDKVRYVGQDEKGEPIYDPLKPLPRLVFEGTIKLHGSNAAIGFQNPEKGLLLSPLAWFQSRERILTRESDNAGFALKYQTLMENGGLTTIFNQLEEIGAFSSALVYGEWCGKGIQKGVAISELSKRFVVFAIRMDGKWLNKEQVSKIVDHTNDIYNIYEYPTWMVTVDFQYPELSQNKFVEFVAQVEAQCPVGAAHGVNGVGEGLVFSPISPEYQDGKYWFKVKGQAHSASKVRILAAVDVEQLNSVRAFVEATVTTVRCEQSISKLRESHKPLDRTSLGDFIRWIFNDIVKEETDTAKSNGLSIEKMGGEISKAAKRWFFDNESRF